MTAIQLIQVVDSHTAGEPTRVVVGGAPDLPGRTMAEKREALGREHDWLRSACTCEPRGHEALIGALLCESAREDCVAGVVFFNNVSCLRGCVHGTIGVAETLVHLGRIGEGEHGIETPVGVVHVRITPGGPISVRNVRSYRRSADVLIDVPGYGRVRGDIAWGGNWFFLTEAAAELEVAFRNLKRLTEFSSAVRGALKLEGITGDDGAEVDHVEVFGPPADADRADSRNFVLCPGGAYDRSPCGTGTSAKLACLHASGRLRPGERWRQAGILNTVFEGTVEEAPEGGVIPTVSCRASIIAKAELILDPMDPFRFGIPSGIS